MTLGCRTRQNQRSKSQERPKKTINETWRCYIAALSSSNKLHYIFLLHVTNSQQLLHYRNSEGTHYFLCSLVRGLLNHSLVMVKGSGVDDHFLFFFSIKEPL